MSGAVQFLFRFFMFAVFHSVFAIPTLKKRISESGRHVSIFYRLYYNIVSVFLFGWVMAAFGNSDVLYVAPGVWSLVMYAMQLIFLVVIAVCVNQTGLADFLGISGSATTWGRSPAPKLVTGGLYGMVRHPLYLFTMLFLLCNPVISVRWLLLIPAAAVYFLVGARLEEVRLLRKFGSEYQAYQSSVPFIIPNFITRRG